MRAFAAAGCDAVLVDGLRDLNGYCRLRSEIATPFVCNQLAGGKTPPWSLDEMSEAGVRMVIYSTPCLFAAQGAVMAAMERLKANQGRLANSPARGETWGLHPSAPGKPGPIDRDMNLPPQEPELESPPGSGRCRRKSEPCLSGGFELPRRPP